MWGDVMGPWRVRFVRRNLGVSPQERLQTHLHGGEIDWPVLSGDDDGIEGVLSVCPICGHSGAVMFRNSDHPWSWNADMELPTLTPSVLDRVCGMHVFVRDVQIIDAGTPPH